MATYAQATDVEVELGRLALSPAETAQWTAWLDRVERSIERRFTRVGLDLATQVAAGDPSTEDVQDVMVAAVLRKVANPTGTTSVTRSVDDATITTRHERDDSSDPLSVTPEEWEALLPAQTSG
ncbi:MAG TPA: Gp19/Gp15/Gp42 family protein, partial [Nocardioidaceae bacterium]|nr:Gp19/Gp15/Gp42 family protein [Nocardioidaceae bacterium]